MDLSKMSPDELNALKGDIDKALVDAEKRKRQTALQAARAAAAEHGYKLEELVEGKLARAKVAPKYRNPANASETWTGRGRKPLWVIAHLDAGGKMDEVLI